MTLSIKRIRAIMTKDFKSLLKNYYVLFSAILPLALAWSLRTIEDLKGMETLIISVALAMTGSFVQAAMISEEKEKHTLRVLLLSPATTTEIMVGKNILTGIVTLIIVILSIVISGFQLPEYVFSSLMIFMLLIFFLALGTIVGLVAKTIMEATIVSLPILIIFSYSAFITELIDSPIVGKLIQSLPTEHFAKAYHMLAQGGAFGDIKMNLLNILCWTLGSILITLVIYKKRRFDS